MTISLRRIEGREIDHELIWGTLTACILGAARWFPFDWFPLPSCPFKQITGYPCCACGMTRSLLAFARGNLVESFVWNPLIALCALGSAVFFLYGITVWGLDLPRIRWSLTQPWERICVRLAAVFVLSANWIYLIMVGR